MTDPADHPQRYPSHHLAGKIANGDLSPDVGQQVAAEKLDSLIDRFCHNQSRNWITKLLRPSQPVTGLYIYGGVGRGKTMLMGYVRLQLAASPDSTDCLAVAFS